MRNVREELKTYGWDVIDVRHPGEASDSTDLFQLLGEFGAMAAVRVSAQIGQVELCVTQAKGGIVETLRNDAAPMDAQVLTLRITEALRAHGLDLGTDAQPRSPMQAQPATPPKPEEPPASRPPKPTNTAPRPGNADERTTKKARGLWSAAAPAVWSSPRGPGTNWGVWLELQLKLSPTWSLGAMGFIPVSSSRVDGAAGTAEVATYLVGGSIGAEFLHLGRWSAFTGAAASLVVSTMDGYPQGNDFGGTNVSVAVFAPFWYGRLDYGASPNWRLFSHAVVGATFPQTTVSFGSDPIRTWGRPFFIIGVGIETQLVTW